MSCTSKISSGCGLVLVEMPSSYVSIISSALCDKMVGSSRGFGWGGSFSPAGGPVEKYEVSRDVTAGFELRRWELLSVCIFQFDSPPDPRFISFLHSSHHYVSFFLFAENKFVIDASFSGIFTRTSTVTLWVRAVSKGNPSERYLHFDKNTR